MNTTFWILAALASIVTVVFGPLPLLARWRERRRRETFNAARKRLRIHYPEAARDALAANSRWNTQSLAQGVISRSEWICSPPYPLSDVRITLVAKDEGMRPKSLERRISWPLASDGSRITCYTDAIMALDKPKLFWDSNSYILRNVELKSGRLHLSFSLGRYFDAVNTQEVNAYLAAVQQVRGKPLDKLYRRRLPDGPYNFSNRAAVLAISTLTIVQAEPVPKFYIHSRSRHVAAGPNTYHLIPAGEFEQADEGPARAERDFDLSSNVLREYLEEFLDRTEYRGKGSKVEDYWADSLYVRLRAAIDSGELRLYCLGLVLNPLSWKPELITAAVFARELFNEVFSRFSPSKEGSIIDETFTHDHILRFQNHPKTNPIAQAALSLAWASRSALVPPNGV